MRLFAVMIAGAALFGCARDRRNLDLTERAIEGMKPSENLAIILRDERAGPAYRVRSVDYRLDGELVHDSAGPIYRGYASPGWHLLETVVELEPNDSTIFDAYHVELKRQTRFLVMPDTVTTVAATVGDGVVELSVDYPEAIAAR